MDQPSFDDHPILREVAQGETIEVRARAGTADLLVTDRRLAVASQERLLLDVPIDGLRRIQFDIERERPATLVVVPDDARYEPQVLAVPPAQYRDVADALVIIGRQLASLTD
jgi:hypothetical protein